MEHNNESTPIRLGRETEAERFAREAENSVCSEKFRLNAGQVADMVIALQSCQNRSPNTLFGMACVRLIDIFENAKYVEVGK